MGMLFFALAGWVLLIGDERVLYAGFLERPVNAATAA